MKKMIFFTSLITTFTTAGTVLAMTGSPVNADELQDKKQSTATLNIGDTTEELELVEVPDFHFGKISTAQLAQGSYFDSTQTSQLTISHSTTSTGTDYEGWKLSAKAGVFEKSTSAGKTSLPGTGNLLFSEVSSTPENVSLTNDRITVGGNFRTLAQRLAGHPSPGSRFTSTVASNLYFQSNNLSSVNANEVYTSTINWHLGHNHMTPSSL